MGLAAALASSRFSSAYYVANALLLCGWAVARSRLPPTAASSRLLGYEGNAVALLLVSLAAKAGRVRSPDELLSLALMNAKAAACAASYLLAGAGPLLTWTAAGCAAVWLLCPQPPCPGGPAVRPLTPTALDALLASDRAAAGAKPPPASPAAAPAASAASASSAAPQQPLIVCFFASWHTPSVHWSPAFARLAAAHGARGWGGGGADDAPASAASGPRFASVDLAHWPGLAAGYGVQTDATTSALPAVVLFRGGAEAARVPRRLPGGAAARGRWTEADVVAAMGLAAPAAKKLA